jgi:hypothetical protein
LAGDGLKKAIWGVLPFLCLLIFAGSGKKATRSKKGFSAILTSNVFRMDYPEIVSLRSREVIAQLFSNPELLPPARSAKWPVCRILRERVAVKTGPRVALRVEPLFSIDDRFTSVPDIFTISGVPHFLLANVDLSRKQWYNGICRMNPRHWYTFMVGIKADMLCDMGNHLLAGSLVNYDQSFLGYFSDDFRRARMMEITPPVAIRQLIRVDDSHVLVHKLRFRPDETACDLYDLQLRRTVGFFDFVPVEVRDAPQMVAAGQTVVTSNRRGLIYVTFQIQADPYCIRVFDAAGKRLFSFGNRFQEDEEYEYPREWVLWDADRLKRYGLPKVFAIHAMFVDEQGCIWVHGSRTNLAAPWHGETRQEHFLDGFRADGTFIGRCPLPACFPVAMGPGRVLYAKTAVFPNGGPPRQLADRWVIRALRIVMGQKQG